VQCADGTVVMPGSCRLTADKGTVRPVAAVGFTMQAPENNSELNVYIACIYCNSPLYRA